MSACEQMDARFEQHNTTFDATRAFVRPTFREIPTVRCVKLSVIVNVSPTDDEQDARVPKTGEQGKKRAQAG